MPHTVNTGGGTETAGWSGVKPKKKHAGALTVHDLKQEVVGVCVSGGLDSKTVSKRLVDEGGIKVIAFTADLGQPDETDIQNVVTRMAPCGVETVVVDCKAAMAEGAFQVIQAQAKYDGDYWNTTGIGRFVTCAGLISAMKARGVTVLSHGATGRGNDQVRFERYTNVLAPDMKVYAPWRDPELLKEFPGRKEMAAFLTKAGIEATVGAKKMYSTDANLAGLSHEAEDLEEITTPMTIVVGEMGVWPQEAPDKPEEVLLEFKSGRCVGINGKALTPVEVMVEANKIGGRNGLGISHAIENRIIGTKSRGVYEAPGMDLLGRSLVYLYQAVLDRRSTSLFFYHSRMLADACYDGRWFDPASNASRAVINELTKPATGKVKVILYKGHVHFGGLYDVKQSLYNMADASMEASDGLNPVSSQGFVEIQSVEARAMAKAGLVSNSLEKLYSKL